MNGQNYLVKPLQPRILHSNHRYTEFCYDGGMSDEQFEYDETQRVLEASGFALVGSERQIDHWYIPKAIMSPEEQGDWFDNQHGYALRIREETTPERQQTFITSKQLLKQGDHSAMTNNEALLTADGMTKVLQAIGGEFTEVVAKLKQRNDQTITFDEAKQLIEGAGRKEYITLDKQRKTFRNPKLADVVIDLDVIPDLEQTTLGFWASIEIEYTGSENLDDAQA